LGENQSKIFSQCHFKDETFTDLKRFITIQKYFIMKIVIFGANGKTGSLLVEQALENGHQVIAYVRNPDSIRTEHTNLKIVVGNLNEKLKMKDALTGTDVCISTLGGGSLTHRTPEIVVGISNIVNAMELAGVKRFIYMSSIGAGESRFLMPQPIRFFLVNLLLRVPLADHNLNEELIAKSKLNWTIVRPGGLTDAPFTGDIKYGKDIIVMKGNRSISRANVASFMLKQLSNEALYKTAVWMYE
jgi:putative NADH-flavin reductase